MSAAKEEAGIGHNSGDDAQTVAAGQLRGYIDRIERLEDEKSEIAEQIKEVKAEVKAAGFSNKAMSAVLSLRKKDSDTRTLIGVYAEAMGVFG